MVQRKSKDIAFTAFLFLLGLIIITPIFLMFVSSLKDDRFEIMKDMGSLKAFVVTHPTLHNFKEILFESVQNFGRSFLNSMLVLVITVVLTAVVCSMTGYASAASVILFLL
ncbi:MAG: carbohydrate ABC transporter permease, partial [Spirochaetia bacterium]|nr:carbohydrate ABC transporter permease [Spirochaetia bacterium]